MSTLGLPGSWGVCGCANEGAMRLLRDVMRLMSEKGPFPPDYDWSKAHVERRERLAGGPAQWELFMHYIDKMGWSEHGSGINSSWLTGNGEAALAVLEGLSLDA